MDKKSDVPMKTLEEWRAQNPRPCPFCGSDALIEEKYYNTPYWTIKCSKGHCIGSFGWNFIKREDAIRAWNTRVSF